MAKFQVMSVYDRALGAYMRPIYAPTQQSAVRAFADEVQDKQNPMHKHPEDFDLYLVGIWDDETGATEQKQPPELVVQGKQYQKPTTTGFNLTQ